MIDFNKLTAECGAFGVTPDKLALERLDRYAQLLVEWNQKMNLTAITEPDAIVTRHFADSASFFAAANPKQEAKLIDVGSGAGFPGMVLKILRPDLNITLLDATNKRITFLSAVADQLGLQIEALHSRAEDAAAKPQYRGQFDYATARAVAELRVLSEYCLGFVKVGGDFIAMKGQLSEDELGSAANALKIMGGKKESIKTLALADGSERTLLCIKKISQTPTKYPRCSAQMSKKPL